MTERRFAPNPLLELFTDPLDPGYRDAAARRAAEGPRLPWRRRAALILRTVTLIATGFLLAIAYREVVATEPARAVAHAGLVEEVKAAQRRTDDLQQRSDQLRREVTAAQQAALGSASEELRRIQEQEAATGLVAVHGPGAVVRLADAPVPIDPTTGKPSGAEVSRVLDVDLQAVVNALWAAGAEAIAVNGQRLATTSTIRKAGNAVLVDFRPVTSPYDVAAIGPDDLADRFNASATAAAMRALVEQYGLGMATRSEDDLRLPAASTPALRYARPAGPTTTATPDPSSSPGTGPSSGTPSTSDTSSPSGTPPSSERGPDPSPSTSAGVR
ncbi:MAG TPA: DUF881 domain-containing protein [Micromonosporaceae bacterium]